MIVFRLKSTMSKLKTS